MENKKYFQDKKSRIVFGILSAVIFGLAIYVASPYINTIILAIIVSYILQPTYKFLIKKLKTKQVSASILSTALIILFTLIIGTLLIVAVINLTSIVLEQVNNLHLEDNTISNSLSTALDRINNQMIRLNLPIEITLQGIISNLQDSIASLANNVIATVSSVGSFSVDVIFKLTIFYGLIFTIVPNFDKILNFVKKISLLDEEITTLYIDRTLKTAKAMAWGMLVVALGQSLVGGLLFYILKTPYTPLLMLLLAVFSFIPILGTGMVTIPVGIIYILNGEIIKGVVAIIFQLLVIGNVDGILRSKLIPKDVQMPIFINFIAIFGGLSLWGIWGLIYGPVGFTLLRTTIEVINNYYIPSRTQEAVK